MMKKIYIVLFVILYLAIACISCIHAYEFFGLANQKIMAAILSGAFEVGQAAVLFSLLTSSKDRTKIMPWVLMVIFTIVQIMGNIYACYKHIMLNSQDLLQYFKEPIFIWTNLPDDQATVIVTYVVAAILPICGLLLTSMVTNYIENDSNKEEQQKEQLEEKIEEKIEEKKIEKEIEENPIEEPYIGHPQVLPKIVPEIETQKEEEKIPQEVEEAFDGPIVPEVNYPKQKSHFINL